MSQSNHDVLSAAHPLDWARAEHLLPGYLKKTLSGSDQEWMKQWMTQIENTGGAVADALESETAWVRTAQDVLSTRATEFNAHAGWQKLQAGLQSERAPEVASRVSLLQKLKQWLAKLARMQQDRALQWWQKPAIGALASAMIVGQMGFLAATVKQVYVLTSGEGGRHKPFFNNYRPQFFFRTTDVTGTIQLPEGTEMVMPGDNVSMTVELGKPIAMDEGLRFAIREGGRTVGAGRVTKILK